jgi:hypothetical protein
MGKSYYLTPEQGAPMARKYFPGYKGRKYSVDVRESYRFNDFWSGGSREYAVLVQMMPDGELRAYASPTGGLNPITEQMAHASTVIPPDGMVIVHSIFCGKDMGITFIVSPNSLFLPKMLPASADNLSWEMKVVLYSCRALVSTYNGESNYREKESVRRAGITAEQYRAAKEECVRLGYLNRAGAITITGKNQVSDLYHFPEKGV